MPSIDSALTLSEFWNLGGDLPIRRIGFGAAGIVGQHGWGPPEDPARSAAILRSAVELGINYIDTADAHGPQLAEQIIRDTLSPYGDVVVGTKSGMTRGGPNVWGVLGRPEYLVQSVELSLRNLGVERIDLFQLHRIDPKVPLEDQIGTIVDLQAQGKLRHLGLSEVTVEQLGRASELATIVSVQNRFHLADRKNEPVLDEATRRGIAFIPWFPLGNGSLLDPTGPIAAIARRLELTPAQLILAWLLRRSPSIIPIPGSLDPAHLAGNLVALATELSDDDFRAVDEAGLELQRANPPQNYSL